MIYLKKLKDEKVKTETSKLSSKYIHSTNKQIKKAEMNKIASSKTTHSDYY